MLNMQAAQNFTPEVQERLIREGIYGRDLTNGIPKPQVNPEYAERMKTLENIYNMVQSGELVPKANVQYQQPVQQNFSQQVQYQQPVVQNAPVNNVQNENVSSNSEDNNDLLELFGVNKPSVQQPVANYNQQQAVNSNSVVNSGNPPEQQVINWEDTINRQQQLLRTEAVKHGINGDEVLKWMEGLTHTDYVNAYRASMAANAQQQQVQQQQVQQQTNSNPNLIDWAATRNKIAPSIVDLGDSFNSVSANYSSESNSHPFGLNSNGLKY